MTTQTDLLMPCETIVPGVELVDTIARLESSGALVTGMELVGRCNGSYRLEFVWPQPERKP